MGTATPSSGRPTYYTIRQAAVILGVEPSAVSAAVRVGMLRAVPRGSRLVIPAQTLQRFLDAPQSHDGGRA
jgi:excisionase family DNA binding protein